MRGVVCGQMLVWLTRQKYAEPEQHPIAAGNDNPDVQGPPYPALILSDNGRTFTLRLFAHNGYARHVRRAHAGTQPIPASHTCTYLSGAATAVPDIPT